MSIQTLAELFLVAAGHRKADALLFKLGGRYQPMATAELVDRVRRVARAFEHRGLGAGDRVALMAENGPHWPIVDFATLCSGAVTVPVYPTLLPKQAAYIVADSGARIAVVETREMLEGLLAHRQDLSAVEHFVLVESLPPGEDLDDLDAGLDAGLDASVVSLADLLAQGEDFDAEAFGDRAHQVSPDDLATFVYTSGTTGKPKGVMLSHRNVVSNVLASLSALDIDPAHTALCFLPLAHAYERTIDYIYFYRGLTIAYAESVQTLVDDLQAVGPHLFVSVPRIYEKVLAKVQENVARSSPLKQKIFRWAEEVGREALPDRLAGRKPSGLLGVQLALAERLVFGKIRDRLAGRFEFAISGGAPLSQEVAEFFWGAGIPIYEGYGLTETSPVISVNAPGAVKLGTVGRPLSGVEVKIAEDGEILVRGPNVMQGYHRLDEATAEAIDDDGWFHTGDIGQLDGDGFLAITDRKKEIIVNAYGKNVAPAPIENALKSSRFIGQAVVLGDRRKFLSALLVPDFETVAAWAERQGLGLPSDPAALADAPQVERLIADEVAEVNGRLAHYEQIVSWDLLPRELSLETGELTPTQKVKRRVVEEKFKERIDALYAAAERRGPPPEPEEHG